MALRLYRLPSHSLCTLNYVPRIFLRENKTASAKLFEHASSPAELAEERRLAARREHLEQVMGVGRQQGQNWTSDESLQDAVLRMLVDKYKPMRDIAGGIKTADEKLKANPPLINGRLIEEIVDEDEEGSRMIRTNAILRESPILPGIEGHEPWMTTFKTPSFAKSPQIKVMRLPPLGPPSKRSSITKTEGKSEAKVDRGKMKRVKEATRIGSAKERMLDYRYGGGGSAGGSAPNPTTMRGWQSLIDDRIDKARAQGEFNSLKGHGRPLTAEIEAKNPFISREEFLVNRMIQRQGAAPPWVELQRELDQAISSFRSAARASWIRRAVRVLTMTKTRALLPSLSSVSASDLSKLCDHEWEQKERGFHEAAIEDINSLVRKYNGIAPYAVRRPYHNVKGELELCYEKSGEALLEQLKQREQHAAAAREGKFINEDDEDRHPLGGTSPDLNGPITFWERFTRVLMRWLSPPPPPRTMQQH